MSHTTDVERADVVHAPAVAGDLPVERWRPGDEIRVLKNLGESGADEVLLTFKAGEVWAAIEVMARELDIQPAAAMGACVAFGLITLGYDLAPPDLT